MSDNLREKWVRLPQGDALLRLYALTAGAVLLAGYALFLIAGPGAASPFLAIAVPATVLAFGMLLIRRPGYLLLMAGICGFLGVASVYSLILEWDARSIWFFHARFIVEGAGPHVLLAPDGPNWHPQYPKMLPLVAATVARTAGFWNEALPKLAVPILLSVPVAYILGAWRGPVERCLVLVAAYLVCGRYLWNGYVDGILAVSAVAAMAAGLRYLEGGARRDGYCLAVLIGLLPTLKTEGLLACAAIFFALFARVLWTGEWRAAPRFLRQNGLPLAICLAVALGWFLHVYLLAAKTDAVFAGDPLTRLYRRLVDGTSLWQIWSDMFFRNFRFIWPVAAALLFLFGTSPVRRTVGPFLLAAAVFFLGLTTVYLLTPANLAWHLETSIHRTTITPILLLAAAMIPFGRHILAPAPELPASASVQH